MFAITATFVFILQDSNGYDVTYIHKTKAKHKTKTTNAFVNNNKSFDC